MLQITIISTLLLAPVAAQNRATEPAPVTKPLSVCDVLADPLKYNGQLVTVRGVVKGTDEGTWLATDVPCKKPLVTYGFVWPQFLWLEVADSPSVVRRVGFHTDTSASLDIDSEVRRMKPDNEKDRIWMTYIGLFETRDYKPSEVGRDRAYGFGHMNSAPGQLVIKTVKDLQVERNYKHE